MYLQVVGPERVLRSLCRLIELELEMRIIFTTAILLGFCCSLAQAQQQPGSHYTIEDPNQSLARSGQNNAYFEMPRSVATSPGNLRNSPESSIRPANQPGQELVSHTIVRSTETSPTTVHNTHTAQPRVDTQTRPQPAGPTTLINPARELDYQTTQMVSATRATFGIQPTTEPAAAQDFVVYVPQGPKYFQNDLVLPNSVSQSPYSRPFFFGVDPETACDEWDGFARCGGLKTNPGHWGIRWLRSTDNCEPPRDCQCHKCQKQLCKQCKQPGESCRCRHFPRPNLPNLHQKPVCNCDTCQTSSQEQGLLNVARELTAEGYQQR